MKRIAPAVGAALLGWSAWACGERAESSSAAATQAAPRTAPVESASVAIPLTLPSQLYVENDAWVYARTTGVAESVLADLGAEVRSSQLLATLEDVDQRIALERAQVALQSATREVERQRSLAATRLTAPADSERAELEFQRAQLTFRQAQRDLDLTRITAPFSGAVAARVLRAGRLVKPGDSLFRITATAPLLAPVHVPELAARGIVVGTSAWVDGAAVGGARASVVRASPTIDAASGTRELVLQLATGSRLAPGASVTVRLGAERRTVLAIPGEVVADSGYVLVWADGRTTLRAVTLGARLPDGRVEVLGGLAPGERVAWPRR